MLQRDYLMRMLVVFFQALVKTLEKEKEKDLPSACDTLENAISQSTDIDGATLLSLAPESMAAILQVSGTDPRIAGYIANSLKLESEYLAEMGDSATSGLRLAQAQSLSQAFGFELAETIDDFLDEAKNEVDNMDILAGE